MTVAGLFGQNSTRQSADSALLNEGTGQLGHFGSKYNIVKTSLDSLDFWFSQLFLVQVLEDVT